MMLVRNNHCPHTTTTFSCVYVDLGFHRCSLELAPQFRTELDVQHQTCFREALHLVLLDAALDVLKSTPLGFEPMREETIGFHPTEHHRLLHGFDWESFRMLWETKIATHSLSSQ